MRLYKVVVLVNLALAVGFLCGSIWWWREVGRLRREIDASRETAVPSTIGERRWTARGVVRVVAREINRLFIDHEDIPGLMEAMTMAFEAADPTLLDGLTPGDVVWFTLERRDQKLVLVDVSKANER
jgi:Cu/Ag efflux protein CusF